MRLDGEAIEQYGMSLVDRPAVPTAELDVEHTEIRGRNGSLTKKYAFKDVVFKPNFNYLEYGQPFMPAFRTFKLALFRAQTLDFEDDPTVYRKIKSVSVDDAGNDDLNYGQFAAELTLDPFYYDVATAATVQTLNAASVLTNPGYDAEPYLKVYGTGSGTVVINGQVVSLTGINGFIEIDTAMRNAYKTTDSGLVNLNSAMSGDFPELASGDNAISFAGGITSIDVLPRWRWL